MCLHIAAVREKRHNIYVGGDEYDLSDLDKSLLRNEIFEKLKKINILECWTCLQMWMTKQDVSMSTLIKMHKLSTPISMKEHSVCLLVLPIIHTKNTDILKKIQLTYFKIVDFLNNKNVTGLTGRHTLPRGVYEIIDFNFTLTSLLPKEIKVIITIDDVRLKSNLPTDKSIRFTKKCFYTILGFTESHSGELGDIEGFVQLIPGNYKSDKPIGITGIDKNHLKCDCIQGSIVNGT